MPTLHWIGKDKVINHHLDVPYKVLEHQYRNSSGSEFSELENGQNFSNFEILSESGFSELEDKQDFKNSEHLANHVNSD